MKKISKILGSVILICGILFSACSDMLDIDVDDKVPTGDNELNSANDSLYSVLGILKQVQYLADRYVVLGELRADLMDITSNSDQYLVDISNNNFSANSDNPYLSSREFYSVINNCNYFLNKADTTVWSGGLSEYILQREYAAVKAIRAWTYWQLVLNYGKVPYIKEPILTVQDMNKEYPILDINGVADELINDLAPYEFTEYPYYANAGSIGLTRLSYYFMPISFMLGDLYLWKGGEDNLQKAAQYYHNLISTSGTSFGYRPDPNRTYYNIANRHLKWFIDPDLETSLSALGATNGMMWYTTFSGSFNGDVYSVIPGETKREIVHLTDLTRPVSSGQSYQYKLAPSKVAISNWTDAPYIFYDRISSIKEPLYRKGDLRGYNKFVSGSYGYNIISGDSIPYIAKYANVYSSNVAYLYRVPTLYLRFAEAVNRLEKPSVAMAILKNGLTNSRLEDPNIVNLSEVEDNPAYLDFSFISSSSEESVIGVHARGGGDVEYDTVYYAFNPEKHLTKEDSIQYVEKLILDELALETAFEGNRFHDLIRFAKRSGDASILTSRIGLKNSTAAGNLANENNWFLPSKYNNIKSLIEQKKE